MVALQVEQPLLVHQAACFHVAAAHRLGDAAADVVVVFGDEAAFEHVDHRGLEGGDAGATGDGNLVRGERRTVGGGGERAGFLFGDVQQLESSIETLQTNLKNATDRQAEGRARIERAGKNKKPVPPAVQEEYNRSEGDKAKIESQIAQKRKEIAALNQKYDEIKKRYAELTGASAKPAPQTAPAKK